MTWDTEDDWEDEFSVTKCKVCGSTRIVPPGGNKHAKILIIGEAPGEYDLKAGKPFVGPSGRVLKAELSYFGFSLFSHARVMNIWIHEPNNNQSCLDYGLQKVLEEAQDKDAILFVGSDVVKLFSDKNVSDVNGLRIVTRFPTKIQIAMLNPAIVFQRGETVGEIRFSLKNFIDALEELK